MILAHLLRVDHYDELLPHRGGSVVVCPNGFIDLAWDGTEAIAQAAEQDWLAVDISHT